MYVYCWSSFKTLNKVWGLFFLTDRFVNNLFGCFLQQRDVCTSVCVYVCMCMYACMRVCMYMYVCMYVCVRACMHACMHVCMYVCIRMYVCMYVGLCMYIMQVLCILCVCIEFHRQFVEYDKWKWRLLFQPPIWRQPECSNPYEPSIRCKRSQIRPDFDKVYRLQVGWCITPGKHPPTHLVYVGVDETHPSDLYAAVLPCYLLDLSHQDRSMSLISSITGRIRPTRCVLILTLWSVLGSVGLQSTNVELRKENAQNVVCLEFDQ